MPFAIVADLPLGTYRGAGQDGRPSAMPSVARLHCGAAVRGRVRPPRGSTGP